jgi:hypothetical protein
MRRFVAASGLHLAAMKGTRRLLVIVATALLTAACASADPGLMSFREYAAARPHSFPRTLQIQGVSGALFYYGAAHTNDPANPQIAEIQRFWREFQPTFAFNEGGAPPVLDTLEETVGRSGESALVRWLARRDGVPVESFEPSRVEIVAALVSRFTPEQIKVANVLRGLSQDSRRAEQFRVSDIDGEVNRVLTILSRTRGLEGAPRTASEFAMSAIRLVPPNSDWRRPAPEWFDPVPDPPPTWFNAFARAESNFRDEVIMQKLAQKVQDGERVFAVIGGSHVVMQERALRSRLASR